MATVAVLLAFGCASPSPSTQEVVAAGDIANCRTEGDEATAELVDGIDATVLALGDEAYPRGAAANFEECYGPTWGRFKGRTKPVPGNHEYYTEGARGYFEYFGEAAGDPQEGYYSYEIGSWHVVALNSNCEEVRCGPGSPQRRWLEEELAANDEDMRCTLAYMHHPRFSSGEKHGSTGGGVEKLWEALYEAETDVVLSGHEHNYERFSPQDPQGRADFEGGIRQFVVGTGGGGEGLISEPIANSEVRTDDTDGVLKLILHPKSYEWEFVPVEGESFTDSGSAKCH